MKSLDKLLELCEKANQDDWQYRLIRFGDYFSPEQNGVRIGTQTIETDEDTGKYLVAVQPKKFAALVTSLQEAIKALEKYKELEIHREIQINNELKDSPPKTAVELIVRSESWNISRLALAKIHETLGGLEK